MGDGVIMTAVFYDLVQLGQKLSINRPTEISHSIPIPREFREISQAVRVRVRV